MQEQFKPQLKIKLEPTHHNKLQALKIMADLFNKNKISFSLGGSGLLYFLELTNQFNDWDLVIYSTESDLLPLLKNMKLEYPQKTAPYTSSFFIRIEFLGVRFDLMGNFGVKSDQESVVIRKDIFKKIGDIPLGNPQDWMLAYKLMGREEKYHILKNYLEKLETPSELNPLI